MSGEDNERDERTWEDGPWAPEWSNVDRRDFLLTLGVAGAGAAAGCTGTDDEQNNDEQNDDNESQPTIANDPAETYLEAIPQLEELGKNPGEPDPERWYENSQEQIRRMENAVDTLIDQGYQIQANVDDEFVIQIVEPSSSPSSSARVPAGKTMLPLSAFVLDPFTIATFTVGAMITVTTVNVAATYLAPPTAAAAQSAASWAAGAANYLGGQIPSASSVLNQLYASDPYLFLYSTTPMANPEMRKEAYCYIGSELADATVDDPKLSGGAEVIADRTGGCDVHIHAVAKYAKRILVDGDEGGTDSETEEDEEEELDPEDQDGDEPDDDEDPGDSDADDEHDEDGPDSSSSITVRLIDAETGEPIPDGTVTLMYFERADDPFGPKSTDDEGVVTYAGIDADHPRRAGEYGVRGRAAGYADQDRRFTLEENRSVGITLELEPEETVERSVLTVTVLDAETGDPVQTLPNVYVDHEGERVETARANDQGRARISLEDGREYTVSAMDEIPRSSDERTVTVDGDTEITLRLNDEDGSEESETHVLTVNVLTAEGDPLHAYVRIEEVDTSEVAIDSDGEFAPRWRFELENGTYTVEVIDPGDVHLPAERTVEIDGGDEEITVELEPNEEHPGIEPENESEDEDDEEEPSSADTRTVWVPDPDSNGCSRMTVPADAHPDPAFETEEACLEYDGGFGGGGDTAEGDADEEGEPEEGDETDEGTSLTIDDPTG